MNKTLFGSLWFTKLNYMQYNVVIVLIDCCFIADSSAGIKTFWVWSWPCSARCPVKAFDGNDWKAAAWNQQAQGCKNEAGIWIFRQPLSTKVWRVKVTRVYATLNSVLCPCSLFLVIVFWWRNYNFRIVLLVKVPSVLWHCWLGGRKGIRPVKKLSGGVLAWLSAWSEVQTCMWPSWCHCHSLSLASVKSGLVLPFWYRFTRVVLDKGPLNGCVYVCFLLKSWLLWVS